MLKRYVGRAMRVLSIGLSATLMASLIACSPQPDDAANSGEAGKAARQAPRARRCWPLLRWRSVWCVRPLT